jgi:hypothetical protein
VAVASLSGTEGFPLSGQVATFASTDVQGTNPQATIAWGDGHTTSGVVVPIPNTSNLAVDGQNTYAVPGTYTVTVTVMGTGGSTESGQGKATIAAVAPQATGTTITPVAGESFTGVVASFTDAYPSLSASNYQATVAWGDGHTSIGMVAPNGSGGFSVSGTNTYAAPGSQTVTVTITRLIDNQKATATTNAVVVVSSLTAIGTPVVATAGQPFTGMVASFTDANPQAVPANYQASIAWGDGQSSAGTVEANGQGGFNVIGTHVYAAPSSSEAIVVTIVRLADGQTVTANSTGVVVNAASALSGQLDPLSDTGVSNSDGITAINQPTFRGTAAPYAIVQLFARRSDQAQPVLLGRAIANANGAWNLAVGALPDGVYAISIAQIPPGGLPTTMVPLTPSSWIIIDTVPPHVVSAKINRRSGRVAIVLQDNLSGLDPTRLANPTHYALLGPHGLRTHPSSVTIVPNAPVRPSDPITVVLQFSGPATALAGTVIALGGITDVAGNPLTHQYFHLTPVGQGDPAPRHSLRIAARRHHG